MHRVLRQIDEQMIRLIGILGTTFERISVKQEEINRRGSLLFSLLILTLIVIAFLGAILLFIADMSGTAIGFFIGFLILTVAPLIWFTGPKEDSDWGSIRKDESFIKDRLSRHHQVERALHTLTNHYLKVAKEMSKDPASDLYTIPEDQLQTEIDTTLCALAADILQAEEGKDSNPMEPSEEAEQAREIFKDAFDAAKLLGFVPETQGYAFFFEKAKAMLAEGLR